MLLSLPMVVLSRPISVFLNSAARAPELATAKLQKAKAPRPVPFPPPCYNLPFTASPFERFAWILGDQAKTFQVFDATPQRTLANNQSLSREF